MNRYVLRRLLQVIPTMWGVFTILFILTYLMPGDPLRVVLGEEYRRLDPRVIEATRQELGLDEPFTLQYGRFLWRTLNLDLGYSYVLDQSVIEIIGYRMPRTLQLMSGGLLVALVVGLTAGIVSAQNPYSWIDHLLTFGSLLIVSVPVFVLALLLQLFLTQDNFGIALFPVAGYEEGSITHMILPSLVLGLTLSATLMRVTRAAMLEVRRQAYITTAYAKGLRKTRVILRHQFRNALIPIITIVAQDVGYLLGGSLVTETIFNWPGLGRAIVPAIQRHDTPVILGILLFGSLLFVLINLLTDILYVVIDPRIQYVGLK